MSSDKVTLRDIYQAVEKLEEKLDKRFEKNEDDIAELKAFQNKALGILGVFTTLVSLAVTFFWNKVTGTQ